MPARPRYRADVDGLRALAVLPVMLFHAGVPGFGGGFVGVDVFFVISGYLITSIIAAEIRAGTFTLTGFYERRIRRIFPALFLVMAACVPAAVLILVPEHLEDFGQSVIATALFVSNLFFYTETGYFEGPAELHPLLHTWSLAVEEQFYLIFPLLLAALYRRGAKMRRWLALIALSSFAFGLYQLRVDPAGAFYLLPGRFWELGAGALLALGLPGPLTNPRFAAAAVLAGLGLIGLAVAGYTEATAFPGMAAALPVLGSVLVIWGGGHENAFSKGLAAEPLRRIGLMSYSLYLWHFPLMVFSRHLLVRPFDGTEATLLIGITFGLAWMSWRYVEQPFRRRGERAGARAVPVPRHRLFRLAAAAVVLSVAFGLATDLTDGAPWRLPVEARYLLAADRDKDTACLRRGERCTIGAASAPMAFAVWGDSHASALLPALDELARTHGVRGRALLTAGCPPLLGVTLTRAGADACRKAVTDALAALEAGDERTVVLAARWTLLVEQSRYGFESGVVPGLRADGGSSDAGVAEVFESALDRTVARLKTGGRSVVLIGPVPEIGWHVPHTLAQRLRFGAWLDSPPVPDFDDFMARNGRTLAILRRVANRHGVELVLPHEALCGDSGCRVVENGRPLYFDTDHLTRTGARRLVPLLEPVMAEIAARKTVPRDR